MVRAYNAEEYQEDKFTEANKELTETQLFTNRSMAIMMPLMNTVMNGLMLAVYWIGAYLIDAAEALDKLTTFSNMVVFSSVDVRDYTLKALRDKIGYVPQQSFLFKGTIASNVAYGDTERNDADVKMACDVAQATEFIDKKDKKYDSGIAQGGSNVSGGQKQRLSIARAVYRHPEILIFDDSFSALDFKTDRAVRDALEREAKNSTKLIVAQRIGTIMNADRIIVLDDGKVVGQGTHHELLDNCEVYRQIAESQLSEDELNR